MKVADIRTEGLVKRYRRGRANAVNNVRLEVMPGEFLGLLGPNGAGKTTLISMLCGVLRPTEGRVIVQGHDVAQEPQQVRRCIGVVPQEIALYDMFTAWENLAYFGRLQGLDATTLNERGTLLLGRAGLLDRADDQVRDYSGGMKRRLNLITALLHRPAILFLDEPTAGVDVQSRAAIHDLLREVHAEGTTVIYTSHHLEEAARLCTRVVIMDHGRQVAEVPELEDHKDRDDLEGLFLRVTGTALRDRA